MIVGPNLTSQTVSESPLREVYVSVDIETDGPVAGKHSMLSIGYGLFEPLGDEQRQRLLREISGALPEDYLLLVGLTEGLDVGNISILGVSQIYEVVMPDWNYYVVAELQSVGVLAVKAHSKESDLYFLDYEGGRPRRMGTTLAEAVKMLITGIKTFILDTS